VKYIFIFLILCSSSAFAQVSLAAKFKGVTKIETILSTRIGATEDSIDLGNYIGVPRRASRFESLLGLMGAIKNGTFKNGSPNGINFLLWYLVFESFTKELSLTCDGTAPAHVSSDFRQTLTGLCGFQDWSTVESQNLLDTLWFDLMSYQAPIKEFDKWKVEVLSQNSLAPKAKLKFALMLLLMNPYFLLEE
jgi:hypothetical protein